MDICKDVGAKDKHGAFSNNNLQSVIDKKSGVISSLSRGR